MKANFRVAALLAVAMCVASCGGSNTSQYVDLPAGAPDNLSYPDPNLFTQGVPIPTLVPTVAGAPTNYTVIPDLPAGLKLNFDGTISGTPTEPRATATYLVTAGNSVGTASFGVRITVHGRFTVGGVVNGLTGTGLVLTNNGGDNLAVSANGTFAFNAVYPVGTIYAVAVATQPTGQTCSVAGGSGYLTNVNYGGVVVACSAVTSKAMRGGSTLNEAVQALASKRSADIVYLSCLDVIDQITELATPLGDLGYQCGPYSVTTDGAWIYVSNAVTNTVSVHAAPKTQLIAQ